jgi:transposase
MLWRRGRAYSQDLRERVLAGEDSGMAVGQIARRLHVSVSYVSKVLSRRRKTGETKARVQCCHLRPKLAGLYDVIRAQVKAHPDATLMEIQAWLLVTHKVSASEGLVCETLALLGLTRKKSRSGQPSRIVPTLPQPALNGAPPSPA